jgi:molybdopterin-containing oxidoreductase family iron-sulfur binding subunit
MTTRPDPQPTRRALMIGGAAALGALIAPGVRLVEVAAARPASEGASSKVRWGLLIDANRCSPDCKECVLACEQENGLKSPTRSTDAQWIRKVDLKDLKSCR